MFKSLRLGASLVALALVAAPASAATILINFSSASNGITVSSTGQQNGTASATGSILIDTGRLPADQGSGNSFFFETLDAPFLTTSISFTGDSRAFFGGALDITNRLRGDYGAGGYYAIGDERTVRNDAQRFESSILGLTFNGTVGQQTVDGVRLPVFSVGQLLEFSVDSNYNDFDADGEPVSSGSLSLSGQLSITGVTVSNGAPAVPEPATWGTMLIGFGLVGAVARRRRAAARA